MKKIQRMIDTAVRASGKKGIPIDKLPRKIKVKSKKLYRLALDELQQAGKIVIYQKHCYAPTALGLIPAQITRVDKTFGFARKQGVSDSATPTEYFIPGRFLKGTLPGDDVLLKPLSPSGHKKASQAPAKSGRSLEAQVISILQYGEGRFSGTLIEQQQQLWVVPDGVLRQPLLVAHSLGPAVSPGDKVLARVKVRGNRHADHLVEILSSFGTAASAKACAEAALATAGIHRDFPEEVAALAEQIAHRGILPNDLLDRLDLRDQPIFTIDGADAKDLDDAISIARHGDGYLLSVHIADVSHYLPFRGVMDQQAFQRGTSIYFASQVIPMLPKALSNGLCSLTPNQDRLSLTALLTLDASGQLTDYRFCKSVIRSRLKGVYHEVNQLFAGQASPAIVSKYQSVEADLSLMRELAALLSTRKQERGAPALITSERHIITDASGVCVEIRPRKTGEAEQLIELFMLTANEAAARFATRESLPILYRVHEKPSPDKLATLTLLLRRLGISYDAVSLSHQDHNTAPPEEESLPPLNASPATFAHILEQVKGTPLETIVNLQILRTMQKARYLPESLGHYGLALSDYAHFTSPIRRYPDLVVHRTISAFLAGKSAEQIAKRYRSSIARAGSHATHMEIAAMQLERSISDYYQAEFMLSKLDQVFSGVISGVAYHGIYVRLQTAVEGLIPADSLPDGFLFDECFEYRNQRTGQAFRVGDSVVVRCARAHVSSGRVDFLLEDSPKASPSPA